MVFVKGLSEIMRKAPVNTVTQKVIVRNVGPAQVGAEPAAGAPVGPPGCSEGWPGACACGGRQTGFVASVDEMRP